MTAIAADAPLRTRLGVAVVPLLALAVFINYVDRGNLATAGPLIKDELHLSAAQFGLIVSAFFWSYTPGQLLAGWMADRVNPYRTLALGVAVWSLATVASGLVTGFAALIGLRILLGLGETAVFPCAGQVIGGNLPEHQRGAANGLVGMGTALGPAFGTFVGGLVMAKYGWRPAFLMFGSASLLWLVPWALAARGAPRPTPTRDQAAPSFGAICRRREAWGAGLGHFANNYAFYFVITWLPVYLVKARGYSMAEMATTGGLIYITYAASSFSMGWLADRLIAAGRSVTTVRKTWAAAGLVLVAAALVIGAAGDAQTSLIALYFAAWGFGIVGPTMYSIGQTLAGPHAGGKWIGFQNGLGNIAGIVGPVITGVLVDRTGGFGAAFAVSAGIALVGVFGWLAMIPKVAPIDWAPYRGS
ncbi:MFS transporter [Phenylobacterium sp.]|uniref:MFS transporter n=1 Tax=Phenylobacterium sp. TaxID=1871053 RepID=UPI0025E8E0CB|nr:MFS transporter [Phenylobacterium sp.]